VRADRPHPRGRHRHPFLPQVLAEAVTVVACPDPACPLPAEVTDRWHANGAPLPVEMVRVRCLAGHWFCGAMESLAPALPR